jgi:hypothetical protein
MRMRVRPELYLYSFVYHIMYGYFGKSLVTTWQPWIPNCQGMCISLRVQPTYIYGVRRCGCQMLDTMTGILSPFWACCCILPVQSVYVA